MMKKNPVSPPKTDQFDGDKRRSYITGGGVWIPSNLEQEEDVSAVIPILVAKRR